MMITILNKLNRNAAGILAGVHGAVLVISILIFSFPQAKVHSAIYYLALAGLVIQSLTLVAWVIFFIKKSFFNL